MGTTPTFNRIDVIAEVPEEAGRHFAADELATLVWMITLVNAWNRIAISSRLPPARESETSAAA